MKAVATGIFCTENPLKPVVLSLATENPADIKAAVLKTY